jgi:hypothetical protein
MTSRFHPDVAYGIVTTWRVLTCPPCTLDIYAVRNALVLVIALARIPQTSCNSRHHNAFDAAARKGCQWSRTKDMPGRSCTMLLSLCAQMVRTGVFSSSLRQRRKNAGRTIAFAAITTAPGPTAQKPSSAWWLTAPLSSS